MPLRGIGLLPLLLTLWSGVHADEAIDRQGRHHAGELVDNHFVVKSTGDQIAFTNLRSIAFTPQPISPAKVHPSFRLHLRDGERISGRLIHFDAESLEFQASFGAKRTFKRGTVIGVEQPDGFRRVLHDTFDGDLMAWATAGSPSIDKGDAAFDGRCLRLDRLGQSVQRDWKPAFHSGRISLHFHDPSGASSLGWQLAVRLDAKKTAWLDCFSATAKEYSAPPDWRDRQPLARRVGWHLLQVDFAGSRCRVYVNDFMIGEHVVTSPLLVTGLRFQTTEGKPTAWRFDFVEAVLRGEPIRRFESNSDADVLFLPGNAEYFGTLERGDERRIALEANRRKQSFSWDQVQGFAFRGAKQNQSKPMIEVLFRPGPGVTSDRLFGTAIHLEDSVIRLSHPDWGDVRLERNRLDRLLIHDRK